MGIEMDRVIQSDDGAWEVVETAKAEAESILLGARRRAEEIAGEKQGELASAIVGEQEGVLSTARAKAGEILREASLYTERIRNKEAAVHELLIDRLLAKVATS